MRNKKLKSKIKNLKAKERKILSELLDVKLDKRIMRSELFECKAAKAELGILKQKLNERLRVECRTHITPLDLRNAPDDYVKWTSEKIANGLTQEMGKTFVEALTTKIQEELSRVSAEEMFSPPCGTFLKVSVPVFKIDIDGLNVTKIDMHKEVKG